jgi:AcrR family transcriptional regulator
LTANDIRRAEILERLADHVLAHGLFASSLRALAAAAGTSDRMLLYYFKDKPELVAATIATIAGRLMAILGGDAARAPKPFEVLKAELARSLFSDQFWPYMRLWLEIAALSAKGDPFYRQVGGEIGKGFLAWGAARLDCANEAQRRREAARLLVAIEGMLLLKSIGLDDVVDEAG